MPPKVKPKRAYDSSRRREQAEATRRTIVATARQLFLARGFGATSIEAIAEAAGVSAETVYAAFGNKRTLLERVVDTAISGDDAPEPVLDRSWVGELRAEPRIERRIEILARNGRLILERVAPIFAMLTAAAGTDPAAAEVAQRYRDQRFTGQRELVRMVCREHRMPKGTTIERATDVVFAIGSPETYLLLVRDRGWSPASFERWYVEMLRTMLIA